MNDYLGEICYNRLDMWRRSHALVCLFKGHDVADYRRDDPFDENGRCWRCCYKEEELCPTIPDMLHKVYAWLCRRQWRWFDALDEWISAHWPKQWGWPSWWNY